MALKLAKVSAQNGPQILKIHPSKEKIDAILTFYYFEDHSHHIAYIPALDISGYGDTKYESHKMACDILEEVFISLSSLSNSAIHSELKKYGWSKAKYSSKKFIGSYIDKEGVLRNFNLSEKTEISEELLSVGG